MNKIIQIGNLVKAKRDNPNRGRLYYGGGISPAIYNFAAGGGHGIFIIETHEQDSYTTADNPSREISPR